MSVFTSVILTIMTFFMTLLAPFNTIRVEEKESDFVPVVRFASMSDTHVGAFGDARCKKMQKAISLAYQKADECSSYKKLDGIMFSGDLTNKGKTAQFLSFLSVLNSSVKEGTKVMTITADSHDNKHDNKSGKEEFAALSGFDSDWHYMINGYHFIGLSTSSIKDVRYSDEQIRWADEEIAKAVADDPAKPVFFTHHEHVSDTVYGSAKGEWGTSLLKDVFAKYPQIIHISGHSHYPLNDPRSVWQGDYTCIGTGSIYYMEFTVDGVSRIHPKDYDKAGQFWLIEVDKNNNVRLRGYDVYGESLLCEYILKDPTKAENRDYCEKAQSSSSAPQFENGAKLNVRYIGKKATVTVPKANSTDGKPVFLYRVTSYDKSGNELDSQYCVNNYWTKPCYESVKIDIEADKNGYISAVAENAYGMQSRPLTTGQYKDDDNVGCLVKNDTVTFSLGANAGTGYEWKCTVTDGDCVKLISSDVVSKSTEKGITGGRIEYQFTLKAVKDGSAKVNFKYARSWEQSNSDKTVVKNVTVTDGAISVN